MILKAAKKGAKSKNKFSENVSKNQNQILHSLRRLPRMAVDFLFGHKAYYAQHR
jgi:hypothetical protein